MSSVEIHDINLVSLSSVTFPSNVLSINIDNCKLTDLVGLPSTVMTIDASNNKSLVTLTDNAAVTQIIATNCAITSSTLIPTNIVNLNLRNNLISGDLTFLQNCVNLSILRLSYNKITSLLNCPATVKNLEVNNNLLTNLQYLPITVQFLDVSYNNISDISHLTINHDLNIIQAINTGITNLLSLPPSCTDIITDNMTSLSNIPITLINFSTVTRTPSLEFGNAVVSRTARSLPFLIPDTSASRIHQSQWKALAPFVPIYGGTQSNNAFAIAFNAQINGDVTFRIRLVRIDSPSTVIFEKEITTPENTSYEELGDMFLPGYSINLELQARVSSGTGNASSKYGTVSNCAIYF